MTWGVGGESHSAVKATYDAFYTRFYQCGDGDGEFPDTKPAGTARDIGVEGHGGHRLDGKTGGNEKVVAPLLLLIPGKRRRTRAAGVCRQAFSRRRCEHRFRDRGFPQQVADEMVLADIA